MINKQTKSGKELEEEVKKLFHRNPQVIWNRILFTEQDCYFHYFGLCLRDLEFAMPVNLKEVPDCQMCAHFILRSDIRNGKEM